MEFKDNVYPKKAQSARKATTDFKKQRVTPKQISNLRLTKYASWILACVSRLPPDMVSPLEDY